MWLAEYYKRRGLFVLFGSFLVRKLLIKTAYCHGRGRASDFDACGRAGEFLGFGRGLVINYPFIHKSTVLAFFFFVLQHNVAPLDTKPWPKLGHRHHRTQRGETRL